MRPNKVRTAAKERFSYPLRPRLARWGEPVLPIKEGRIFQQSFVGGRRREPGISL